MVQVLAVFPTCFSKTNCISFPHFIKVLSCSYSIIIIVFWEFSRIDVHASMLYDSHTERSVRAPVSLSPPPSMMLWLVSYVGNKDCDTRLCHLVTKEKVLTRHFRQLRKVVSVWESYFIWCVLWTECSSVSECHATLEVDPVSLFFCTIYVDSRSQNGMGWHQTNQWTWTTAGKKKGQS